MQDTIFNAGDLGLIPGLGRSPVEGNGKPLQYSWLGNPMDRGAWWTMVHGVTRDGHNLVTMYGLIQYALCCVWPLLLKWCLWGSLYCLFFFFLQLYDISSMNYTTIYLSIIQLMDYCFQVLTCYEQSQHDCSCRVILVGIYTTISNFTLGGLVL